MLGLIISLLVLKYSPSLRNDASLQWQATIYFALVVFFNTIVCQSFRLLRLAIPSSGDASSYQMSTLVFHPSSTNGVPGEQEGPHV